MMSLISPRALCGEPLTQNRVLMRPSNRSKILNAAQGIITAQGTAAVTFEAVAEAAGVSRGGVLYHFANKTELLVALHEHLAVRWERELVDALGAAPEDAPVEDRIASYAAVSERSATGAELLLMIEASLHGEMRAPYSRVAARWVPDANQVGEHDVVGLDRLIAVLAADGLWASDLLTEVHIPERLRGALARRIGELARGGAGGVARSGGEDVGAVTVTD